MDLPGVCATAQRCDMRIATACLTLLAGVLTLASPANAAHTTTYVYDGLIDDYCSLGDPDFLAEFPELCINGEPAVLSVTFRHDEPI